MMTQEQLETIRKRAQAATSGPWQLVDTYDGAWILDSDDDIISGTVSRIVDAEFIAHAREDIPKLLAEIERISSIYKRLSVRYAHTNKIIEDAYELLSDSYYDDHPTFVEVCEYLNAGGDE